MAETAHADKEAHGHDGPAAHRAIGGADPRRRHHARGSKRRRLQQHFLVPGTIMPDADRIARVAVRLLGTVAELRKRLGDTVEQGEIVAVIESREVADAKSEYLAARLTNELQQTFSPRGRRSLWDNRTTTENEYLRARAHRSGCPDQIRQRAAEAFALGLTSRRSRRCPISRSRRCESKRCARRSRDGSPSGASISARWSAAKARKANCSSSSISIEVWVDLAVSPADICAGARKGARSRSRNRHATDLRRTRRSFSSARCSTRRRATRASSRRSTIPTTSGGRAPSSRRKFRSATSRPKSCSRSRRCKSIKGEPVVFVREGEDFRGAQGQDRARGRRSD